MQCNETEECRIPVFVIFLKPHILLSSNWTNTHVKYLFLFSNTEIMNLSLNFKRNYRHNDVNLLNQETYRLFTVSFCTT